MPCTLAPWEITIEEKLANRKRYGVDVTDVVLLTRLLCEAVKLIPANAERSDALIRWTLAHRERDARVAKKAR